MAITLKRPIYAWENRDVTSGTPGGVEIADFSDGAPLEFIQWLYPASTSIYILYLHRVQPASSLEKGDQQMHKDPAIRYPGSGDSTNAVQRRSNLHHGNFKLKRSRVDYDESLLRHLNIVCWRGGEGLTRTDGLWRWNKAVEILRLCDGLYMPGFGSASALTQALRPSP